MPGGPVAGPGEGGGLSASWDVTFLEPVITIVLVVVVVVVVVVIVIIVIIIIAIGIVIIIVIIKVIVLPTWPDGLVVLDAGGRGLERLQVRLQLPLLRSKQRDPDPQDAYLVRKEPSTYKGFQSTTSGNVFLSRSFC